LKAQTKSFHHYHKVIITFDLLFHSCHGWSIFHLQIMDQLSERNNQESILNVGVVYVLGTIGDMGECVILVFRIIPEYRQNINDIKPIPATQIRYKCHR
jgi:hypothetical protein